MSGESAQLIKQGNIQNKDLAIEVCAQDWPTKYDDIWSKYSEERQEALYLREHLLKKQEMYIYREHEYRNTIGLLKKEIDENSHKPLLVYKDITEDELQLQGLKLSLNEPTSVINFKKK